ncbi:hypothetical protein GF356_09635 [candidate division GN15 bacterium]|nr:hypothetical protein [candidate division GN15 bacterium]
MAVESHRRLTVDDLKDMENGQREESSTLEFKRELWCNESNDGLDKKEMLKDISAMANAHGGIIIVGMDEEDSRAKRLCGFRVEDQKISRINSCCRDRIQEPISELDVYPVDISGQDKRVIVIDIPNSPIKPHVVKDKDRFRCYKRMGTDNQPCDLREIRDMVLYTEAGHRRARRYYEDWYERTTAQSKWDIVVTLVPTMLQQPVLFSIQDLEHFFGNYEYDDKQIIRPFSRYERQREFFLDGIRSTFDNSLEGEQERTIQRSWVYDNGMISVIDYWSFFESRDPSHVRLSDFVRVAWAALVLLKRFNDRYPNSTRHEMIVDVPNANGLRYYDKRRHHEYQEEKFTISLGIVDKTHRPREVLAQLAQRIVRAFGTSYCDAVQDDGLTDEFVSKLSY